MARVFLFLQGPHGPFFADLARRLAAAGHGVARAGLTAGDRAFWPRALPYRRIVGPGDLASAIAATRATDIVLYGDTRPVHAEALRLARARGLTPHVFEEGYLRPWWITYERGGANGASALHAIGAEEIAAALPADPGPARGPPPDAWGAMAAHVAWGAAYHACVFLGGPRGPGHRGLGVAAEVRLWLRLLALMPVHRAERALATRRLLRAGVPFQLVLLQLAHDANFRDHGPFASMETFLDTVIDTFARAAPAHHHLVFKAHPLDDGRVALGRAIRARARAAGVALRVHFIRGGKLARLLDAARGAITVNSTAAQQALWRGLPVKAFGRAVYARPGLVADQPLAAFLAEPEPPDPARYAAFRRFLLATSQVEGSFYAAAGRRRALRAVIDLMLAGTDPTVALLRGKSASTPAPFALPAKGNWRRR